MGFFMGSLKQSAKGKNQKQKPSKQKEVKDRRIINQSKSFQSCAQLNI